MTKHTFVTLTHQQRQQLESVVRTGQQTARKINRARILLLLDRSQETRHTASTIAAFLGCHQNTVGHIRRRFVREGLERVLTDKPMGPTVPYKMTGEIEAQITLLACSDPPEGYGAWTVRLLADKTVELGLVESLSRETVRKTLKKIQSNPGVSKPGASANLLPTT